MLRARPFLPIVLVTVLAGPAGAADPEGQFAVDGVGARTCADFLAAREAEDSTYFGFAGWTDGFISALNVLGRDTYDLTPFQPVELTLAKMAQYCEGNGDEPYVEALGKLVTVLMPDRIAAQSDLVRFAVDGQAVFIYREMLDRVRDRLAEDGNADAADLPDDALGAALADWQGRNGLPRTGLPDVATLNAMFP